MVSGGGGAYLISGNSGGATVTVEETAANVTHATRVSQATVSQKKETDSPLFVVRLTRTNQYLLFFNFFGMSVIN